jgi:pyruvate/2-oxoglutarate dehydrogenase complex dihydrolipoamide acyltransferase (E2) component
MRRPILVPELGVAVSVVSIWYARPGERLHAGDRVVELLLGAATFDVAAPCTGTLVERSVWPDESVLPGQVLGYIEEEDDDIPLHRPGRP